MQIEICWRQNFKILITYKPSLGTCEYTTQNLGPIMVQPIIGVKRTDKQASKVYIDKAEIKPYRTYVRYS